MRAWRQAASQAAQDELDAVFAIAMRDATRLVRRHGEFYPFAVVRRRGADAAERVMVGDDGTGSDHPNSDVLIARLVEELRGRRDELAATALALDVYASAVPVIRVELEHRDGIHLAVHRPYRPRRVLPGAVLSRRGTGVDADARIWAP